MEKLFRAVGQGPTKQRILRPLHEFLEEQQEPFLLEDYLLDRQYSSKRIHSCPNSNSSKDYSEGLPKLVLPPKGVKLQNAVCFEANGAEHSPWHSAGCFLEMNQSKNKKRRRIFGGKTKSENLDILGYSEEYHVEEFNINIKRLKFTVQETKEAEINQVESTESVNMEDVGASISKCEGSLLQYTKIFSFRKEKKIDGAEKSKESEAEKSVKCSLFKSILRKLTPTKLLLPHIHTDLEDVSKKLADTKRNPTCIASRVNQIQPRVSDIVSWNSFKNAAPNGNDHSGAVGKESIFSECPKTCPDLMDMDSFSAKGPEDLLQSSEGRSLEMEVASEDKKGKVQPVIGESNSQSSDVSPTRSSSISLYEPCFKSDLVSTSVDKISSNNSFEGSLEADFHPPQDIDSFVLEATYPSGCLSLDSDEYRVKDCQPGLIYGLDQSSRAITVCDAMSDSHEMVCSSIDALMQDYMHSPTPTVKSFSGIQISGHKENPMTLSGYTRNGDSRSGKMNCNSQEDEDEKNVYSDGSLQEQYTDVHGQGETLDYASDIGSCVESKQLSPVSVLEVPFEEETSLFGQSAARKKITQYQLFQRLTEYSQQSCKDPLTSEQKDEGKYPSESEYRNFSAWNQDNADGIEIPNLSQISSQPSSFQWQEERDWEQGGTEEYVRKLLNSSETMLCLLDLNDKEANSFTCFRPPNHIGNSLQSQCSKGKEIPMQPRKLLFDCVKEILESPRIQYGSGVLKDSWLKECFVPKQLAKAICNQIYSWTETDTNVAEKMIELAWKEEEEDWTNFREEVEEIGIEMEVDIFGLLIEELADDLSHLQS